MTATTVRPVDLAGVALVADQLGARSVLEFGASGGGAGQAWPNVRIAHRRVAEDATVDGRADLAVSAVLDATTLEDGLRRVFRAADRFALVRTAEATPPYQVTDWVTLYHRDFTLLDRRTASHGDELLLFERRASRRHTLPGHFVVSMTSYAARFPTLELTLRSILQQTVRPDEVVLWLAADDLDQVPPRIHALEREGLTIRLTEDLRSYKKIIPALVAYPDSFIMVVDDDLVYPDDLIEPLVAGYRSPHEILCRRAHRIRYDAAGRPFPYLRWSMEVPAGEADPDIFPTSGGGTLYPPRSLHPQTTDLELFDRLAPTADDVWLYWMARRAGSVGRVVGSNWNCLSWPGSQDSALMAVNWKGGNDRQVAAMLDHFGPAAPATSGPVTGAPTQTASFDSALYWSRRYAQGGHSGAGSYGRLAEFKAEILNAFVQEKRLRTVIEFGSGDGAQLRLADYPAYLGFDVAQPCLDACRTLFAEDATKSFKHTDEYAGETADLTLSLDVIYHLIEDEVFETYMARLFEASDRYVIVYASNVSKPGTAEHVRHRRFTDWVETHRPDFALVEHVPNRYPLVDDGRTESFADFYIFERHTGAKP